MNGRVLATLWLTVAVIASSSTVILPYHGVLAETTNGHSDPPEEDNVGGSEGINLDRDHIHIVVTHTMVSHNLMLQIKVCE